SFAVGLVAALAALALGIAAGLVAGYIRWADGLLMRVMDGIMAIPAILIAIAVVALWRASLATVIVAIAIPEIPRVTRLVRGRVQFVAYPHNVFFPGLFLAVTVLAVNMLGDGLRDTLDPKLAEARASAQVLDEHA